MKPKDEQILGSTFLLISRNSAVDMAVKNRVVDGSKPVKNRHQERGTEHGDDVLRTDSAVRGHVEALVRLNDFARLQRLAVTVDLPREQIGHAIVSLTLLRGKQKRAACHSHCSGAWTRARFVRKMGASIVDIGQSDHAVNRPTHITGDGQPYEQRPPNRHSTALDA